MVFFVGVVSLGGVRIANQAPQLKESMSKAIGQILGQMQQHGLNPELLPGASGLDADSQNAMGKSLLSNLGEFISLPIEITTDALVIVVAGIYFAAHPVFYVQTIISLIPLRRRRRAYEVAHEIGHALRLWLIGRFCAMISVGLLITAGLEVLDVKLALLLGLISSILTFMPYLGAIISAIPAILVALLQGPLTAFSVVLLFLIAHVLESYILIPLIQQRALSLAPAYLILAQLLGWLAAGIFGVLLATPLAVVLTIIVQMIYLGDILGDKVHILGEHGPT